MHRSTRSSPTLVVMALLGSMWLVLHTAAMAGASSVQQRRVDAAASLGAEALAVAARAGAGARQRDTLVVHRGAAFRLVVTAEEAMPGFDRVEVRVLSPEGRPLRELDTVLPREVGG